MKAKHLKAAAITTYAFLIALTAFIKPVSASDFLSKTSVELIGPSWHSVKTDTLGRAFNNWTPGIGVGYALQPDLLVTTGLYRNSFKHPSFFAELDYTPLHAGRFDFGAGAGVVTGYKPFNGGHAAQLMAGLVGRYHLTSTAAIELRVIPLWNGIDPKHSTHFGGLFNTALRLSF